MDISKAVLARRSISAFKYKPVPKGILGEIMEKALRALSWTNIQPWEFVIASDSPLLKIRRRLIFIRNI
jgi:nitroreductase